MLGRWLLLAAAAAAAATRGAAGAGAGAGAGEPVDPASIPSYVISLKRTPRRFSMFMKSGVVARVLPALTVFDAVDGGTLDPLTDERFSVLARVNMLRKTRRSHTDLVTQGMSGLYVSHVEVWKRVVASGAPMAIVLEDDAAIEPDLLERMRAVLAQLPPPTEWDVWILGCVSVNAHRAAPGLHPLIHEVSEYYGTQAYVVSRRGAQRLAAAAYPMSVQVDAFMAQASMLGMVRTLWRADGYLDVKQLLWAGTTVQQLYCDLCDLPHDYNRFTDVATWLLLGAALGLAALRLPTAWLAERLPCLRGCLLARCLRRAGSAAAAHKRSGEDAS